VLNSPPFRDELGYSVSKCPHEKETKLEIFEPDATFKNLGIDALFALKDEVINK